MVEGKPLFELFFKLFRLKDKQIRKTVHKFIVRDVKKINQKTKNHSVNKSLQNFMYTMLQDQDVTAAFKSLQVTEDLYKKKIWNDEKTVNVLSVLGLIFAASCSQNGSIFQTNEKLHASIITEKSRLGQSTFFLAMIRKRRKTIQMTRRPTWTMMKSDRKKRTKRNYQAHEISWSGSQ